MRVKYGRLWDDYRGHGAFVSFPRKDGWLMFAVRLRWHLYWIRPQGKPHVARLYVGPFMIERARLLQPQGANA
jgi:hypothetical protein